MTLKEDLEYFNGVCSTLCDLYQIYYPFTIVVYEITKCYEDKFTEYLSYYKIDNPKEYLESFKRDIKGIIHFLRMQKEERRSVWRHDLWGKIDEFISKIEPVIESNIKRFDIV